MDAVQIFSNPNFGQIRTLEVNNQPYFVGRDVALALGYSNPVSAISQHVDNEDSAKHAIPDNQGLKQNTTIINESGVYALVFGSKLPTAKAFKRWVTSEVLPAIRKTGGYISTKETDTPEEIMARALTIAQETLKQREERISLLQQQYELQSEQLKEAAPKVEYVNNVLQSVNTFTTNQIAKELGYSAETLNKKLKDLGVQYKQSGQWLLSYKYQNKGYTKTRTYTYTRADGSTGTSIQTVWTESGRMFIHNLLKEPKTA